MKPEEIEKGKTAAIIGYLTLLGFIIAITMNLEPKNAFARFHIRQAFGIHIVYHALAFFFNFSQLDFAWNGLFTLYLVSWGYGFIGALQGNKSLLPAVGRYFQKWFTFIS